MSPERAERAPATAHCYGRPFPSAAILAHLLALAQPPDGPCHVHPGSHADRCGTQGTAHGEDGPGGHAYAGGYPSTENQAEGRPDTDLDGTANTDTHATSHGSPWDGGESAPDTAAYAATGTHADAAPGQTAPHAHPSAVGHGSAARTYTYTNAGRTAADAHIHTDTASHAHARAVDDGSSTHAHTRAVDDGSSTHSHTSVGRTNAHADALAHQTVADTHADVRRLGFAPRHAFGPQERSQMNQLEEEDGET